MNLFKLTFSDGFTMETLPWSWDGKYIAYGSNNDGTPKVFIMDSKGLNKRKFAQTKLSDGFKVTWTPKGQVLYQWYTMQKLSYP